MGWIDFAMEKPIRPTPAVLASRAMRYVIHGAGAVGAVIGGRLHQAGQEVVLIARGPHLEALRRDGLRLRDPDADVRLPIRAVGTPADAELEPDDVVVLATKTQDADAALDDLATVAPEGVVVACAQNGVENERLALRRFAHVLGVVVFLPAAHVEPGEVATPCAPVGGVLDVGLATGGTDAACERLVTGLRTAGFASEALADVMVGKRAKLLRNLVNAADAALGDHDAALGFAQEAGAEGRAAFAAAGLAWTDDASFDARHAVLSAPRPVPGADRGGSSTWQSLARGTGSVEAAYLNGEIALLGRLHGVPTPVNDALLAVVSRLARTRGRPGDVVPDDLRAEIARRTT